MCSLLHHRLSLSDITSVFSKKTSFRSVTGPRQLGICRRRTPRALLSPRMWMREHCGYGPWLGGLCKARCWPCILAARTTEGQGRREIFHRGRLDFVRCHVRLTIHSFETCDDSTLRRRSGIILPLGGGDWVKPEWSWFVAIPPLISSPRLLFQPLLPVVDFTCKMVLDLFHS